MGIETVRGDGEAKGKVVLFANTDWYLYNFRLSLAEALKESGYDVLMISPSGSYGALLKSMGFSWRALPMDRRSLNPLRELRLLAHLVRLFRAETPDIVHGFTIKAAVYGGIAGKIAGVRAIVNSVNGLGYIFISNDIQARLLRPVVRRLMSLAFSGKQCRVIVQNPTDKEQFIAERVVAEGSIDLIPGSGVDCEKFAPVSGDRPRGDGVRVLLPARLLWDKGIGEFVEASRIISGQGVRFLVAGEIDQGNPAAVRNVEAEMWQEQGLVAVAWACRRHAGIDAWHRCGRIAELSRRIAKVSYRGRCRRQAGHYHGRPGLP